MKRTVIELLATGLLLSCTAWAQEDPQDAPEQGVARISLINGDVSIRRGDSGDWVAAAVNAPLVVYDHVITGANSRAEIQFDYANLLRLGPNTEIRIAQLENRRYQVQLARGIATLSVLRDSNADIEVDTPNVSVRPVKRGDYRIMVRDDGDSEVTVRSGEAEVFTPKGIERVGSGRTMIVRGPVSDPEYRIERAAAPDEWDRWNEDRDKRLERSGSYQYVSQDIYGADDLDSYGRWVYVPPYGWVWSPNGVAADWAPYRYGRWSWLDYYGWSWVSYDPWGWAPYHYGRWFHGPHGWCWYPGAIHSRHYWSPGLVAFFGFGTGHFNVGIGAGFGNVGWVPLAPYEPYHRWYGRGYYGHGGYGGRTVNNITVVNNTNITNIYRNARVANGITGIGADEFGRGRGGRAIRNNDPLIQRASLVRGAVPVTPSSESLRVSDRQARVVRNEARNTPQRFYTRRPAAAVERVPFDQQRRGMEQMVERSFGRPAAPGGESVRGGVAGEPTRAVGGNAERGQQRSEQRGEQRGETSPAASGWRRMGEPPQRAGQPDAARVETSPAAARARQGQSAVEEPTRVERQQAQPDSGNQNWRQLGERPQGAGRSAAPAREQAPARIERQQAQPDSGNRERPQGGGQSAAPAREQAPARIERQQAPTRNERQSAPQRDPRRERKDFSSSSNDGWRGFSASPRSTPRVEATGPSDSWRGFGSPSRAPEPRMETARPSDSFRGFGGRSAEPSRVETQRSEPSRWQAPRSEPLRINPPIVRERSMPRMESRGGGGSSRETTRESGGRDVSRQGNGRRR